MDDEVEAIYALNLFFRGSERLKKEPTAIRASLVGAALTRGAAYDFHRVGLFSKRSDPCCKRESRIATLGPSPVVGLRYLRIEGYPCKTDPNYTMLKQLLNRNRRIQVIDYDTDRVTNGDEIDRMYAFNRFFLDSQSLMQSLLPLLPPLVAEALINSASCDFPRAAVLMANHPDALCELVHYLSLPSSEEHDSVALEEPADTEYRHRYRYCTCS